MPYGVSDAEWNALDDAGKQAAFDRWQDMDPEQQLSAQALAETINTRDTNRAAVLGAYDSISRGQELWNQRAAEGDQLAAQQQGALGDWALGSLAGHYGTQTAATNEATTQDYNTLGQMADLTALTGQRAGEALQTRYANDELANNLDLANLDVLNQQQLAANYGDRAALLGLEGDASAANLSDAQDVDYLRMLNEGLRTPTSVTAGADLTSAAGAAAPNSYDVESQQGLLEALTDRGYAPGIESEAAGVGTDAEGLGMQRNAAGAYGDVAGGALSLDSAAARASADPYGIAGQRAALASYFARSGTGLTAAERAMMEQARRNEERDRKAYLDARLTDLNARGMGGSGAEIAATMGSQQQTSENRMLQDMLALAMAQERSERMLGAGADLAGQLREQSFGEQFSTGSAADRTAEQNRATMLDALSQYTDLGSLMREESFGERMTAAEAADAMALANRDYSYGALTDAADLATQMREQGFEESYQTGQSSDLMAQYNRDNSIDVQQYNAELQRLQNQDVFNRAQAVTDTSLGATEAGYTRDSDVYDASRDVTGDTYDRALTQYGAGADTISGMYDRAMGSYDATATANQDEWQRGEDLANQAYGVTGSAYDRYTDLANTGYQLTDQGYQYGQDTIDAQHDITENAYEREQDRQEDVFGATELFTGTQRSDQTNVNQEINSTRAGIINRDAIEALGEGDDGLFGDEGILGLRGIPIL